MKKVLIVDDNADIRELVKLVVRRADRMIFQAGSGAEAVKIAREVVPDLIFMDVMMPGDIDGQGAARILKGDPRTRKCPIIVMTARVAEAETTFKADAFLGKPFILTELIGKTEKFLDSGAGGTRPIQPVDGPSDGPSEQERVEDD